MDSQSPSTLASFQFTTIGKPPSLLTRIGNNFDSTAVTTSDASMQIAGPSSTAPSDVVRVQRPLASSQRPTLLEQLAPEALATNATPDIVPESRNSIAAGSAAPPEPSSLATASALFPNPLQAPSSRRESQEINTGTQQASSRQTTSGPTIRIASNENAMANSLSSHPQHISTPSQTQADAATELYNKLTALASEHVQWNDIGLLARRFREEQDEYRRRHDETLRTIAREKEQMEVVMRVAEATFDRLTVLEERQRKRLLEERERLTNSARAAGLVPLTPTVSAAPAVHNVETVTTPDRNQETYTPSMTAPVTTMQVEASPDDRVHSAVNATPTAPPSATTMDDGAESMVIDSGGNAQADAEEQTPGVRQQHLAAREDLGAELESGKQHKAQRAEASNSQIVQDVPQLRARQEKETLEQNNLEPTVAANAQHQPNAVDIAHKESNNTAKVDGQKHTSQAQEQRQSVSNEPVGSQTEKPQEMQGRVTGGLHGADPEHRRQEPEAQTPLDLAAAEKDQEKFKLLRERYQAKKRAEAEQEALKTQQELKHKRERYKPASEEAIRPSSIPANVESTPQKTAAKKPTSVISAKKSESSGTLGGDAAASSSSNGTSLPVSVPSSGVLSASSGVVTVKRANRKVKEQSAPVKLEVNSPPPITSETTSLSSTNQPPPPATERPQRTRKPQTAASWPSQAQSSVSATEILIPPPSLPAKPPGPLKHRQSLRPQDQTILGKPRDPDRSHGLLPHTDDVVTIRSVPSISAAAESPVLPADPDPPLADTAFHMNITPWSNPSRMDTGSRSFGDDNGMVNDPRHDYVNNDPPFRDVTPEEIRYARNDHWSPQAGPIDPWRYEDRRSPLRSFERRSPLRKRLRDDDEPGPSYPPPRRARYSGSLSNHGSPPQRRRPLPDTSLDRGRSPLRMRSPPPRYPLRSPTPPRAVYRPRSPDRGSYGLYANDRLTAASPVSSLPSLAYPNSPEPPRVPYHYDGYVPPRVTPPPRPVALAPPHESEMHGLLDRITEPRPKRNTNNNAGRKQSNNNINNHNHNRQQTSQTAKRGKPNSRNIISTRMNRGQNHSLVERLATSGLESRIS
ncbi:hypothetical protein EIP86_003359 [Pleurotus ostreatoroseus]|nr:hypothetical protein EIP86_003359 [Pleurotus ostreatoroseus]